VTDGQTDGQTDIPPLAIPAVGIARYSNALVKMQEQCSEYFVEEDFVKKGQFKNDGSFEMAGTKSSES